MAADVLSIVIDHEIQAGRSLPAPEQRRGARYGRVRLPGLQAAKGEIYRALVEAGIRKAELTRRLGIARPNVDRLFDLRQHSRFDHIEAGLKALGKELEVTVRDAA